MLVFSAVYDNDNTFVVKLCLKCAYFCTFILKTHTHTCMCFYCIYILLKRFQRRCRGISISLPLCKW